jgi:hypothetical protein
VGKLGVYRNADHFHVALLEIIQAMIEGDQLGRAHKSKVQGIEKYNRILPGDMLFEIKVLIDVVIAHHSSSGEIWGGLADEYCHVFLLGDGLFRIVQFRRLPLTRQPSNYCGFQIRESSRKCHIPN